MTEANGKSKAAPLPDDVANDQANSAIAPAENARAHLRLVTPESLPEPEPPARHGTLVAILAVLSALMGALGYFAVRKPVPTPVTIRELVQLRDVYVERGIDSFLEEKEAFRLRIRERLASRDDAVRKDARNVAALMFPELLADDDFERELGVETWAQLERAMESAPNEDPARRRVFEDFRNMLLVYENGNRSRTGLSPTTRAVLELYEAVSAPR